MYAYMSLYCITIWSHVGKMANSFWNGLSIDSNKYSIYFHSIQTKPVPLLKKETKKRKVQVGLY
jgi:hypothetical protein